MRIKEKLSGFLQKDVEIRSWMDVYNLFEESFEKSEKSKALFVPFFNAQPPSSLTGASPGQIRLYRGAFVDPSVLDQPEAGKEKVVTYRGQTITVTTPSAKAAAEEAAEKPVRTGKVRYYRGARIES